MKETGRQPARRDLLDIAMDMADDQTGARMDDDQLRALVFTFLFAGHETTGVGMSWTLYELAKYPKIQEKIRKEANEVLGDGTYPLLVVAWLKAAPPTPNFLPHPSTPLSQLVLLFLVRLNPCSET